jgi:Raf kinase inhibitor-like YbhB/YbcL family protein
MKRFISISMFSLVAPMLLGACSASAPTATAALAPTATPAATATPVPAATDEPISPPAPAPSAVVPEVSFTLTSTAFAEGETISDRYTYRMPEQCDGANISPELTWAGVPAGVQSFAVIAVDPDGGDWVHWVQFNIPGDAASLTEAEAGPDIGVKGQNDFGQLGYGGPCPPSGTHRYIFTLYALDTMLSEVQGATRSKVEQAMADHVLGQAQLTGLRNK